jgi:hypothetical protein
VQVEEARLGGWVAVPARHEDAGVRSVGAGHPVERPRPDATRQPAIKLARTVLSADDTR